MVIVFLTMSGSGNNVAVEETLIEEEASNGKIYLYCEAHVQKKLINTEYELWEEHYENGTRHLFIEVAYYDAVFLNV